MEKVVVDSFMVPEESKASFREGALQIHGFISSLPGYVDGFLYEQKDGDSRYNFMSTAVWESEAAFEDAKKAVNSYHEKEGTSPQETRKRLRIESIRAIYEKSA